MPGCEHCLIEFPEYEARRDGKGRAFCCNGCLAVFRFINDEGLSSFYDKRDWDAPGLPRPGVPEEIDVTPYMESVREKPAVSEMSEMSEMSAVSEINKVLEADIYLDGIRCASCVWLVERVLKKTEGVVSARVNYATHRARIRWDPEATGLEPLLMRIYSTGYIPKPYSQSEAQRLRRAEGRDLLVRFGTAAFLSSQLMIYSVALYAGYFQGMEPRTYLALETIAMLLCLPVVFYSGMPIFRSAVAGLGRMHFNMDSLIAIGAGSAFIYSVYGLFTGGKVFFDTAAMIITLILLGRYIESSAKGKAAETMDRLAELVPREATIVVETDTPGSDETRRRVPVETLRVGDMVEVVPGEKFPVDGTVERGESEADESLLTGESLPVFKGRGAHVTGGSQNLYGSVVVRASRVGRDTVLSGIIRAVEDAQAAKPRIQGMADRVVGVFVPIVLVLAAATTTGYYLSGASFANAVMTGISVLVIACPCSLGLATPLAQLVYTMMASSKGLLIKSGESAELASRLVHVVFDKTGTLTTGSLSLEGFLTLTGGLSDNEAIRLAASVEMRSEHPLGLAIVRAARERFDGFSPLEASGFRAHPGKGVTARVDGRLIAVGNRALMDDNGLVLDKTFENPASEAASCGETVIYMGWDGHVSAMFMVLDTLRPEAKDAVRMLKALGCRVSVISGDSPAAVENVSARAGTGLALGGVLPEKKREAVAGFERTGGVLMVGDGINDAPALTEAAVGVAMGRGTDIAMESADAVLLRDDLRLVPYFIKLSRKASSIIRQNIFWAFFYNVVALPLAVMGILHPIIAAAAMASSSLVVVGNSLRLRKVREVS